MSNQVVMQIMIHRTDELEKVGDDVYKFAQRMRKTFGKEVEFAVQVGINPHASEIDQRLDEPKKTYRLGYLNEEGTKNDGASSY